MVARLGKAVAVVIHDPEVERSARQFGLLILARLILAAGGSAELVQLILKVIS